MLNTILKKYSQFSDIFLISNQPAKIKVNGILQDIILDEKQSDKKIIVNDKLVTTHIINQHKDKEYIINFINNPINEIFHGEKDFSIVINENSFRVNLFKTTDGLSAVLRLIPNIIPEFNTLGLPSHLLESVRYKSGLVLVTGVTGSGKSTTLASLLNEINKNMSKHILTIEDPIEFRYTPIKSLITQREVGSNTNSFSNALRAALREAPDVILVGEMRDKATIETALKAAETGHTVFSTLHTFSAIQTIERIMSNFEGNDKDLIRNSLANVLKIIISQKIIITTSGKLELAYEILYNDFSIANNIKEGKFVQIKNTAESGDNRAKNCFLNKILKEKVDLRKITLEDAMTYSYDSKDLEELMKK
jgi:twitching motility protein PilT